MVVDDTPVRRSGVSGQIGSDVADWVRTPLEIQAKLYAGLDDPPVYSHCTGESALRIRGAWNAAPSPTAKVTRGTHETVPFHTPPATHVSCPPPSRVNPALQVAFTDCCWRVNGAVPLGRLANNDSPELWAVATGQSGWHTIVPPHSPPEPHVSRPPPCKVYPVMHEALTNSCWGVNVGVVVRTLAHGPSPEVASVGTVHCGTQVITPVQRPPEPQVSSAVPTRVKPGLHVDGTTWPGPLSAAVLVGMEASSLAPEFSTVGNEQFARHVTVPLQYPPTPQVSCPLICWVNPVLHVAVTDCCCVVNARVVPGTLAADTRPEFCVVGSGHCGRHTTVPDQSPVAPQVSWPLPSKAYPVLHDAFTVWPFVLVPDGTTALSPSPELALVARGQSGGTGVHTITPLQCPPTPQVSCPVPVNPVVHVALTDCCCVVNARVVTGTLAADTRPEFCVVGSGHCGRHAAVPDHSPSAPHVNWPLPCKVYPELHDAFTVCPKVNVWVLPVMVFSVPRPEFWVVGRGHVRLHTIWVSAGAQAVPVHENV
jgi:hypothetical protein